METFDFDRNRDFGALIEDTFKLGLRHIAPLLKYLVIFVGPLMVLNAFLMGAWMQGYMAMVQEVMAGGMDDPTAVLTQFSGLFGFRFFLGMVVSLVAVAVTYLLVLGYYNYQRENNAEPSMQDIQNAIFSNIGRLIGFYFVFGLLFSVGFAVLAFIVVLLASISSALSAILMIGLGVFALYAYVKLALAPIILITEGKGIMDSLRTSWELTTGHWWKLFGGIIIVSLAVGLLVAVVSGAISAILAITGMSPLSSSYLTTSTVISNLISLVGYPFNLGVPILMYYTLRPGRAKGGADDMIDQIGADEFFGDNE
ncbi:MAG: hypothetical protein R3B47_14030 [Bacteroidia bacterium]